MSHSSAELVALGGVEAAQGEAVQHTPGPSFLSDLLLVDGVAGQEQLQGPQVAGHQGEGDGGGEGGGGDQGDQQQGQHHRGQGRLHVF